MPVEKHTSIDSAESSALRHVDQVMKSKRWLVVSVDLDEKNVLTIQRTTSNFPRGTYNEVCDKLRALLNEDR